MTEPKPARGFPAFDLALPAQPLVPVWEPLKHQFGPSAAEQIAARREAQERPARLARELTVAQEEWRQYFDRHYANRLARSAFDIHQPEIEYDRVVCQECKESDLDDTVGVEWPCSTYAAMKAAADG